ncbi:NHLP bacteriocin system secretion protein [Legionella jordanis]|uniref:Hemolysin D n=1 Tax=Legionella jordanis TaxID=456 RepID=A0A0W0VAZ5_9GAMM|nr:NHLP bacteriocin system secretion protein [Legionella jordanis]KTD17294.1 hemolysin D [Legionella jordanis]RMW99462.1 NHLP bacteriocin system secretion protein [Legionella jordanis]RMX15311.1 NHLP bacteriocin system secretion protein [Legionella jordanis]VEH12507.1 HlyD family secretion protein [Legionella jordanis]
MSKLFREKSLSRLNNPEKLDNLFRLVSPMNWLILLVLILLLGLIVLWGIYGQVDTRISGNGILISGGQRIYDAIAEETGRLLSIEVKVGDHVKKGQPLAKLKLSLLNLELENKKEVLATLQNQLTDLQQFIQNDFKLDQENNKVLQQNWQKDLSNVTLHLQYLKQAIEEREKVVGKAVSRQELADLKARYYKDLQDRDEINRKMAESVIEMKRRAEANQERFRQLQNKILQTRLELSAIEKRLTLSSVVVSPVDGEVISVLGKPGEVVQSGMKILDIEPSSEHIDAAVYVPAALGKLILPGMAAQVVPSTVKKQEYGSIVGVVRDVAKFPSSQSSMMSVLSNEKLVEDFSKSGPQLYIRIDLIEANTMSGYKWTTSQGPDISITNGTLCSADIIVKTQPPITLVIPTVKQFLGMD